MFESVSVIYRSIFAVLCATWVGAYAVGMLRGKPNADRSRRLPIGAKVTMIAVVLVCGMLWWLGLARDTPAARFAAWIVSGLVVGAGGDLLMAGLFAMPRAEIAAMAAFGVGHVCYAVACLLARSLLDRTESGPALTAAGLGITVGVLGWIALIRRPDGSHTMNVASLLYGLLLFAALGIAVGLWIETGALALLALGLALFAASDLLLAQVLVRGRGFPYIRDVVWIIYSTGQLLIAFSIGAVLVAVQGI